MPTLPQTNYSGDKQPEKDRFQTPPYALQPILPLIKLKTSIQTVWEPAMGEGYITNTLLDNNVHCFGTDILTGYDFLNPQTAKKFEFDCSITNPPFSKKYKFLKRCYEIGKPFALLMPSTMIAASTAIQMFEEYGIEIIQTYPRISYKTPNKGWEWIEDNPESLNFGKLVKSSAQFPSAWFTWGLGIGQRLSYFKLNIPKEIE